MSRMHHVKWLMVSKQEDVKIDKTLPYFLIYIYSKLRPERL